MHQQSDSERVKRLDEMLETIRFGEWVEESKVVEDKD